MRIIFDIEGKGLDIYPENKTEEALLNLWNSMPITVSIEKNIYSGYENGKYIKVIIGEKKKEK